MEVKWSYERSFKMETPGEKTTWQAETKVDRQSGEELSRNRNTRWRNNSTRQRQMEASLCCGNGPQWPLKTEEEEEEEVAGPESLSFAFRISHSYDSLIIKRTLSALKKYLTPIFIPDISTVNLNVKASEFWTKWNFPNCILAIDGKHVRIRSLHNTGSFFFNYKDYFSIVLLAMVDAKYKFIAVDIGSFGREGDSGIFLKSNMEENGRAFKEFDSRESVPINNIIPIARGGDFANAEGFDVREAYKDFFNNEGAVSWQNNL
ncbi:hypothetical protein QTP88_015681 [Uroleucon formosanum]